MQIISQREFVAADPDLSKKTFVIYIAYLEAMLLI